MKETNKDFFTFIQPFQHHTGKSLKGVYLYSFSLKPDEYQPSGSINFSEIEKVTLNVETTIPRTLNKIVTNENQNIIFSHNYSINIYVINYNILRITSGRGGLVYSN
jgi:hypothetical protein